MEPDLSGGCFGRLKVRQIGTQTGKTYGAAHVVNFMIDKDLKFWVIEPQASGQVAFNTWRHVYSNPITEPHVYQAYFAEVG